MDPWIAALVGATIGGFIAGIWQGRRYDWMVAEYENELMKLIARHDDVVKGLIERIKQLEGEK